MTANNYPRPNPSPSPESGVEALKRPESLKIWAGGLTNILSSHAGEIFTDYEFRDNSLTKNDFSRTIRKIRDCASLMELRSHVDPETGELGAPAVHAANYCGQHAICPHCASRVQDRRKMIFSDPIKQAVSQYRHAYIVTATIPPVPTWREDLNRLISSWQAFRKMGQRRSGRKKGHDAGEWGKVRAGLSKVEIKRGSDSGLPHCHIHALFFTDEYLDFRVWSEEEKAKPKLDRVSLRANNGSKISQEWNRATDGAATGIDVRLIRWKPCKRRTGESGRSFRNRSENWSLGDSVLDQAREVLKYATKFDTAPGRAEEKIFTRDFIGIKSATYGRRLFQTYGSFRGIGKPGENDFTGSEASGHRVLYSTRWQSNRYSGLKEIQKPLFPDMEPGPHTKHRLQVLNRISGGTRRIRRAINEAKRDYMSTGNLNAAVFEKRTFLDDGGFTAVNEVLAMPSNLAANPLDLAAWESWVDTATQAGRDAYNAAREDLRLESHFRLVGTPEERKSESDLVRRAWIRSDAYEQEVIRSFREVLAPSQAPP